MDVGLMMIFASYGWDNIADDQVWDEDLRLARQGPGLGFDVLWSAEHHFFDYSFCPDNLQLMTYLAGVCPDIDLGTAAVILPWHDPLRVAEQASVLDLLCNGRLRLGFGRGLARREFELNVSFRFGGISYDKAEASLRLFAREVLPVLKSWQSEAAKAAE